MSVQLNSHYHFWTSDLPISNQPSFSLSSQLVHISSSSFFPFHLHSDSIHGSKLWWLSSKALLPWLSGQASGCWALTLRSVGSTSCPNFSYLCSTVMKKLGLSMSVILRRGKKPKPRHMQHICFHPSGEQQAGDCWDALSRFNTQEEAQLSPSLAGSALAFHTLLHSVCKWHLFPFLPAERC